MKKITLSILGACILVSAGIYIYISRAQAPNSAKNETMDNNDVFAGISNSGDHVEYRTKQESSTSKVDEENPLRVYKPTAGMAGRNALDEIYARGVPATSQSAGLVTKLLDGGKLSREEKIPIIRILASIYNEENTSGANNEIAAALKNLTLDPDTGIAHDATLFYSRLDYFPDTEFVLKAALEKQIFSPDEYYGELAHLIPSAPGEKQTLFLAQIASSSNAFAAEILTAALNSGADFNAAPFLRSSDDMARLLQATEPEFPSGVGEFGLGQAVAYTEWIRAVAAVESEKTGQAIDDIILAKLGDPGTDPRKIMGYLASPHAGPLLASAGSGSSTQQLVSVAQRHARQNPSNPNMSALVQEIVGRMKNPPPPIPAIVFTPPTGPVAPAVPTPYAPQTMPRQ